MGKVFQSPKKQNSKVIVYLHGNAEDVGSCYDFILKLSITLNCSVIAVEYPGYGLFKSEEASAESIQEIS